MSRDFHATNVIKAALEAALSVPGTDDRQLREALAANDAMNEALIATLLDRGYQNVCPVCAYMRTAPEHQQACPVGIADGGLTPLIPAASNWRHGMLARRGPPMLPPRAAY